MFLFLLLIVCTRNIQNHQISLEIFRCERSVTLITIGGEKNGLVCNLLLAKCLVSTQQCFVIDWVNVTGEVMLDRTNQESLLSLFFAENQKHFFRPHVSNRKHIHYLHSHTPEWIPWRIASAVKSTVMKSEGKKFSTLSFPFCVTRAARRCKSVNKS